MKFEIPFEFGQEVFYLKGRPIKAHISAIHIYSSGKVHFTLLPINYNGNNSISLSLDQVYLTREEAQVKIEELINGCQLNMAI